MAINHKAIKQYKWVYMRKICIALSKGGVAKSTTAVSIAHGLALTGKKVLIIDTDDQAQISFLLGVSPQHGLAEVLNGEVAIQDSLTQARKNLWLLAGGSGLSGVKRSIGKSEAGAEQTLVKALMPLEGQFDFILVDTSPAWDTLTISSLFYCTEVLAPVSLEILTLRGLITFAERLKLVQAYNKAIKLAYVLPTFADGRVKKSSEIMAQLKKHYAALVCEPVRYSVRLSETAGLGKTIFEYAPSSAGAADYRKLIMMIMNHG